MNNLIETIQNRNPDANIQLILQAYEFAKKKHEGIMRKSGEPYITHPVNVAELLVNFGFAQTQIICAALLHDVIEDSNTTKTEIKKIFGNDIAELVDGLTKLTEKETGYEQYKAENLKKIILATANDIRIMIIKLVDRLHNMQSLHFFRIEKQQRISQETLKIYAPIAEKIGLYAIKSELEDLSFKFLNPKMYNFIKENINATKIEREKNTQTIIEKLTKILKENKISVQITGRAKHFYSIYKKMTEENKTIDKIYDLYGIRIITEHTDVCYKIHDIFEQNFTIIPNRFKDFIKHPKPNGYQSLHENIIYDSKIIEIQIRTHQMDYQAESGIATHWKYKGNEKDKKFEKKISWMRQVLSWQKTAVDEHKSLQNISLELFQNEIIAITPKGDPITLKKPATALDFAYAIHSSIANHAKAIKVNNKIVPLQHEITSGDIVEVETTKERVVHQGWLSITQNPNTQAKIRKALGIESEHTPKKERLKNKSQTDLRNMYHTLTQFRELARKKTVKISKCCNPKPTDPIVAFYTKDKKTITVHTFDCPNQHMLNQNHKVILQTTHIKQSTNHTIDIILDDIQGALINVLNYMLEQKLTIGTIQTKDAKNSTLISVKIQKRTSQGFDEIVSHLQKINGVLGAKIAE